MAAKLSERAVLHQNVITQVAGNTATHRTFEGNTVKDDIGNTLQCEEIDRFRAKNDLFACQRLARPDVEIAAFTVKEILFIGIKLFNNIIEEEVVTPGECKITQG